MGWRSLMWIVWPSFMAAAATTAVVFALVDPLDIVVFGYVPVSRQAGYSAGFFLFWGMATFSSALSLFLSRGKVADEDDEGDC
ncbi:putative inner membrane protein [plant metagenome]|uniref:Putative inner membrane protein n=1 Tax=plant metagenome TaxID=1297885 RepID=A0A484UG04_9ZZZZ